MSNAASKGAKRPAGIPRPSASVLLISPSNQVLLLHRVRTSSSFPSAHVFPGGNCDPFHDGTIPAPEDPERHQDGAVYRLAAIRETFEESGIVLAKNNGFGRLIEVEDEAREEGRRKVHGREVQFTKWLAGHGGRPDVDGLIPFTRWITPTNVPKRFTTQMYIYFLPLNTSPTTASGGAFSSAGGATDIPSSRDAMIPTPTHDGGVEHTAARFLPSSSWISLAQSGEIILFPPQFFLLSLVARYLPAVAPDATSSHEELAAQRQALREFLKSSDPPWGEKVMSPILIARRKGDGRNVLGLDKPGPELEESGRRGDREHVVLVEFKKEGPRKVEVRKRDEVMNEEREGKL